MELPLFGNMSRLGPVEVRVAYTKPAVAARLRLNSGLSLTRYKLRFRNVLREEV